jgi:hypothetical protein
MGKKFILDFLNFFEAKYDFFKVYLEITLELPHKYDFFKI